MLEWRLLWEGKGCPATSCHTSAHESKFSSQLHLSLSHSQSNFWSRKVSFAFTPEKLRSSFALRLLTGARQSPAEVESQVKALSGSHSPSTDFNQHNSEQSCLYTANQSAVAAEGGHPCAIAFKAQQQNQMVLSH